MHRLDDVWPPRSTKENTSRRAMKTAMPPALPSALTQREKKEDVDIVTLARRCRFDLQRPLDLVQSGAASWPLEPAPALSNQSAALYPPCLNCRWIKPKFWFGGEGAPPFNAKKKKERSTRMVIIILVIITVVVVILISLLLLLLIKVIIKTTTTTVVVSSSNNNSSSDNNSNI